MIKTLPVDAAFGGAGAKAPIESGAACALLDAGFKFGAVAGTSAGSINAGCIAAGMRAHEIREVAVEVPMAGLFGPQARAILRGYVCTGEALHVWLRTYIGAYRLSDLPVPIRIIASNLSTRRGKVFGSRETPAVMLHDAQRASSSVPLAYWPFRIFDDEYVDGGLADNVPGDDLPTNIGVNRVAFYVDSDGPPPKPTTWLQRRLAEIELALNSNQTARLWIARKNGVKIVRLPVPAGFGMLDFDLTREQRTQLFNIGYQATKSALVL